MAVHLTSEGRFYIEKRRAENISMRAIARELERSPSSISRELSRNTPNVVSGELALKYQTNVSDQELSRTEHILNTRGREFLGFYSPDDIFMQHLNAA